MRTEAKRAEYCVVNETSGIGVAARVRVAGTSSERRKGLGGTDELSRGSGLWITPCEAIHTFGMRFPIDALFLDRHFRVRKITRSLRPRRICICLSASSVLELESGATIRCGVKLGDTLRFHSTRPDERTGPAKA
jgi:uncharacterized protein